MTLGREKHMTLASAAISLVRDPAVGKSNALRRLARLREMDGSGNFSARIESKGAANSAAGADSVASGSETMSATGGVLSRAISFCSYPRKNS